MLEDSSKKRLARPDIQVPKFLESRQVLILELSGMALAAVTTIPVASAIPLTTRIPIFNLDAAQGIL